MSGPQAIFALLSVAPGAILAVIGFALSLREALRSGQESRLGLKLNAVGAGLVFLVPGAGLIALVIIGVLMWPAAVGGLAGIGTGVAILAPLGST